jgi:hypothetical protein
MSSAIPISCARLLSVQQTLKLKFVDLDFSNFISVDDLSCDIAVLAHDLKNNSPNAGITERELIKKLEIAIARGSWRSEIELAMRLAFDREAFEGTTIYRAVKEWEAKMPPNKILRF